MEIGRNNRAELANFLLGVHEVDRTHSKQPSLSSAGQQDRIQISEHAKELQRIKTLVDRPDTVREARVEQFQNDPNLKLFLISLKAGGLGLNLHAAEYVYLLDPWWNPAVETQAIDRAHRIGQTRQVFAYRVIARDTVEEKVLALQQTKRDLADAIITADNSLIHNLTREDLELLLS